MKKALERNKQIPDIASIAYKVKCIEPLHQTHDKKIDKTALGTFVSSIKFLMCVHCKEKSICFPFLQRWAHGSYMHGC